MTGLFVSTLDDYCKNTKGSSAQETAGHFLLYRGKDACLRTKLIGKPATFLTFMDLGTVKGQAGQVLDLILYCNWFMSDFSLLLVSI